MQKSIDAFFMAFISLGLASEWFGVIYKFKDPPWLGWKAPVIFLIIAFAIFRYLLRNETEPVF